MRLKESVLDDQEPEESSRVGNIVSGGVEPRPKLRLEMEPARDPAIKDVGHQADADQYEERVTTAGCDRPQDDRQDGKSVGRKQIRKSPAHPGCAQCGPPSSSVSD